MTVPHDVRRSKLRAFARAFILLTTLGAAILAVGLLLGPERTWFFGLVQFAPYPLYLAPVTSALALSWLVSWRWRALAAGGLLLVLFSVMGLELNIGESGGNCFRLLTYNVKDYITLRQPTGMADLTGEIRRHNPDIVVLQDAIRFSRGRFEEAVGSSVLADRHTFSFGQYVVSSRFPLRDCRNGWISFRDDAHTYVVCEVLGRGGTFSLVTAHFMTPRFGLAATRANPFEGLDEWLTNASDRMTQARTLATDIQGLPKPVIMAGDLNAPPHSLVLRTLTDAGLRDAFDVAGRGFGFTWGHSLRYRFSFLRIDHILVGPEFRVARTLVGEPAGSAHRPLIADVCLAE